MRQWITLSLVLTVLACPVAFAQDYSFSVPKLLLEVTPNADASVTLAYTVAFHCNQGADAIDVVDMGLPHKDYDISNMSASVNDNPLQHIKTSTFIDCGVEVHLDPYAIQPGQTGIFKFACTMPDLVYQDTTRADYASLRITPTWWGSEYVTGTTKLGIVVYLPESIKLDEILYQDVEFSKKLNLQGKNAVAWFMEAVRADGPHMVGVSFPKREMERVVRMTKLGLLWKWWTENPAARVVWAIFFFILFGIFFFRQTNGTGISVFVFLLGGGIVAFAISPTLEALALPVLIPIWILAERARKARGRSYLPAIASVEAGGIKRGLTVPEAAVIMELPLGKVLALVIFGMLKKGLVHQTADDPLAVEVDEDYLGSLSRSDRQENSRANGTVIHAYEQPFLEKLTGNSHTPLAELDFSEEMKQLIEKTAERMSGFNLKQTREYYKSIVAGAWVEAKAMGELDARTTFLDDNLLWLMLDDDYDDYFVTWHHHGYYYRPIWAHTGGAGLGEVARAPAVGGRTCLRDVAASFAGWSENVTGNLASTMDPVSVGLADRGGIDLSGADRVTMDVLEGISESSGSGGGGGCACAGCACACACAGGGR